MVLSLEGFLWIEIGIDVILRWFYPKKQSEFPVIRKGMYKQNAWHQSDFCCFKQWFGWQTILFISLSWAPVIAAQGTWPTVSLWPWVMWAEMWRQGWVEASSTSMRRDIQVNPAISWRNQRVSGFPNNGNAMKCVGWIEILKSFKAHMFGGKKRQYHYQ